MQDVQAKKAIFFRSALQSLQSADFFFDNPASVIARSEAGTKALVTVAWLQENEQEIVKDFAELLKVTPDNFGVVSYNEDNKVTFFSEPVIGLDSKGLPGLMIGADTKIGDTQYQSVFVPLTQGEDGSYKLGESKTKVILTLLRSNDDSVPPTPYILIKSKKFIYHIGLRKPKDMLGDVLDSAFDEGVDHFSQCLSKFSAEFVAFGKMFSQAFSQKTFPEKGVLLVLANGTKKETPNKTPGQPALISSMWQLKAYPEELAGFPVQNLSNETVELGEVGMIFCPASSDMTKKVMTAIGKVPVMYVWIKAFHKSGNTNWCPEHVAFTDVDRLSKPTQKAFAVTIATAQKLLAGSSTDAPASQQTVDVESAVSSEELREVSADDKF